MIRSMLLTIWLMAAVPVALAQQDFATPELALDALVLAVESADQAALGALFGEEYRVFAQSQQSESALARLRLERFTAAFREFHSLVPDGDDRYTLVVGAVGWPFAIPIVRLEGQWRFDGAAGVEEMRNRIVGANELNAIALMELFVNAQREYALDDHDGDGVPEFAMRVVSSPGTQDGLYWDVDSEHFEAPASPLAPLKQMADALLGERSEGSPFLGYYFRLLFSQGPNAAAGAFDYRINGHMVAGFAMIAWPAQYGETGVVSFMVNQDHVVYESDLGPDTATIAVSLTSFDPGDAWVAVESP